MHAFGRHRHDLDVPAQRVRKARIEDDLAGHHTSVIPTSAAIALAVAVLPPVSMTVARPMRRSSETASLDVARAASATAKSATPRTSGDPSGSMGSCAELAASRNYAPLGFIR